MAILITGNVVVDETSGTQTNGSTGVADATGNEFTFGSAGTPTVPTAFSDALAAVAQGLPTVGALSGFSTATPTGVNVIDYGGTTVTGVAFVNSTGGPLVGVDSGLTTTDGTKIYLYTYSGDNNVLFGVEADSSGNAVDPLDASNPFIAFAAYLQEGATGAKAWLVQYESLFHNVPGSTAAAYDEPVSPSQVIYVAVDASKSFTLSGAPSGQNLFLMYGDAKDTSVAGDEVALVVTATDAASGGSVNTGQGGGGTTLGSNNQMLDPGEGLMFTFVTNANADYTVANLDQGEADLEQNILFEGVQGSMQAFFTVVQTQPSSKSGTLTIKAFTTDAEPGATNVPSGNEGFLAGYTDDSPVEVTSVVVKDSTGAVVSLSVDYSGLFAEVTGVKAGYTIEYTTATPHNRVEISNSGVSHTANGADFDIGGFSLPGTETTKLPFNALVFQDDGLAAGGTAQTSEVDEDGLTGGNTTTGLGDLNANDGVNDNLDGNEATASGNISAIFVAGADGIASYGFSTDATAIAALPTLTSKGSAVAYDVDGTLLTAYVDSGSTAGDLDATDRQVFTLSITAATGAYAFTLLDQLDHPLVNDPSTPAAEISFEDDLNLQLGSILQAKDGDNDTTTASAEKLVITVDDDSPDALTPGDLSVNNAAAATASALLGYIGNVGADEPGSVKFVGGTDGAILQGVLQDGTPTTENLTVNGLPIYLFGFGTSTLLGTTDQTNTSATAKVFQMTLNPDGTVAANDVYSIEMFQAVANTVDVPFGSVVAHVASGNPLTLIVNDIGGSTVDAAFSGWLDKSDSTTSQTTVNVSGAGVGVGTGQDFNFDANTASTTDDLTDRARIEFLNDTNGNGVLDSGEGQTVNRFTFVMNQNNDPGDDGDAEIHVYDVLGTEIQITGIVVNDLVLVGAGAVAVTSNDNKPGDPVTAVADGLGYELHGLGGGTAGNQNDNDTVTIITASGYERIDISGIGDDASKDTFDILLKSVAIPTSYDVDFTVQANLSDQDLDTTVPSDLDVTLVGVV